jgi:hypothetical protein
MEGKLLRIKIYTITGLLSFAILAYRTSDIIEFIIQLLGLTFILIGLFMAASILKKLIKTVSLIEEEREKHSKEIDQKIIGS